MADMSLAFDLIARDKTDAAFRSASRNAETFERKLSGFGDKLKGALTSPATYAAAGAAVVAFGASSVKAFTESEEAQQRLDDAFARFPKLADTNADALRGLNETLATKTRFDDDAFASGQAVLAQFGLTGKQLQELTPLLADYAGKTGKDLPTAADDLGRAMLGQGRALKEIGVDFKDTGSQAGNFDQIMSGLRSQVGGFAEKDATTMAGRMDQLRNRFGEVQEKIGAALIPVLEKLAIFTTEKLIPFLEDFFDTLGDVSSRVIDAAKSVAGFVSAVGERIGAVITFFRELPGRAVAAIGDVTAKLTQKGVDLITGFINGVESLVSSVTTFWTELPGNIGGWIGDVTRTLFGLGAALLQGFIGGVTSLVGGVSTFFRELPGNAGAWIGDVAATLFDKGATLLQGLFDGVVNIASSLTTWFMELPGKVGEWLGDVSRTLWGKGVSLAQGLIDGVKDTLTSLPGIIADAITGSGPPGGMTVHPPGSGLGRRSGGANTASPIRKFDLGGVVPGPRGMPQLIVAHAGETVLPTHKSGGLDWAPVLAELRGLRADVRRVSDQQLLIARTF